MGSGVPPAFSGAPQVSGQRWPRAPPPAEPRTGGGAGGGRGGLFPPFLAHTHTHACYQPRRQRARLSPSLPYAHGEHHRSSRAEGAPNRPLPPPGRFPAGTVETVTRGGDCHAWGEPSSAREGARSLPPSLAGVRRGSDRGGGGILRAQTRFRPSPPLLLPPAARTPKRSRNAFFWFFFFFYRANSAPHPPKRRGSGLSP